MKIIISCSPNTDVLLGWLYCYFSTDYYYYYYYIITLIEICSSVSSLWSGPAVCSKMWISVEVCREEETDEACAGCFTFWRDDGGWGRWRLLFRRVSDDSAAVGWIRPSVSLSGECCSFSLTVSVFMCIFAAVHRKVEGVGWGGVNSGDTCCEPFSNCSLAHSHTAQ